MHFSYRLNLFLKFHMGNVLSHPGGGQFCMNFALSGHEWRRKKKYSMSLVTEISERVIGNNSAVITAVSTGHDLNLLTVILGCQNIYQAIRKVCA